MRAGQIYIAILLGVSLILANGTANPARALLAEHDCSFCHDWGSIDLDALAAG